MKRTDLQKRILSGQVTIPELEAAKKEWEQKKVTQKSNGYPYLEGIAAQMVCEIAQAIKIMREAIINTVIL